MRNFRIRLKSSSFVLITFAALLSVFTACHQVNKSKVVKDLKIRPVIQLIVDSMAESNWLYGSAVGDAGTRTVQWERYEKLSRIATLAELRKLTNHENAVVKCYAFDALAARKDTSAYTILLSHLRDTAKVSTLFGCTGSKSFVGDYFLNTVTPYDSTDRGYKLSALQKFVVDSILLYDKQINLSARYYLLDDLKPEARYYDRVKELALNKAEPVAILTLARYKRHSDIGIITKAFSNTETEDYAIQAVTLMPDSSFFPILTRIFEREWAEEYYDYRKWRLLYQALAQYPNQSQTLSLFNKTLQTKNKFRYKTLSADLLIAVTKYPNPVFESLKKQIKLDDYEMNEVKEELANNR